MIKLFDENLSYNFRKFRGSNGTWSIHGSKSNGDLENTLDTFSNEHGEFRTYERHQVLEQAKLGNIIPVLETEIVFKDNSKVKRRA